MKLSNLQEVNMTYLSLTPTESGLIFSVDGKEYPLSEFQQHIRSIVSFVSTLSYTPIVAKIEILDNDEYFIHSLNLPILPAFIDIEEESELQIISADDYQNQAKQKARGLNAGKSKQLIDKRTDQYINYIQHEFAAAYINCLASKQEKMAKQIQELPIMKDFDLSRFSTSTTIKRVYKIPQFIKCEATEYDNSPTRVFYVGLQENVPNPMKDQAFWNDVYERDKSYLILDASMNYTINLLKEKFGEIEYLPPTASLNIEETPANE